MPLTDDQTLFTFEEMMQAAEQMAKVIKLDKDKET